MISKHNKSLVSNARELRKNMTKEEKRLWYDFLRTYKVKFLRQKILGKYIADFYCAEAKLVIELDGSGHYTPESKLYDIERTICDIIRNDNRMDGEQLIKSLVNMIMYKKIKIDMHKLSEYSKKLKCYDKVMKVVSYYDY